MSGRLYGCGACGFTGKVPGGLDLTQTVWMPRFVPRCPCGGGEMQMMADPPARSKLGGAGKNRKPAVRADGKIRRRE